MASPAVPFYEGEPVAPAADPVAIRACLTSALVAEFDAEWEIALERAKQTKDLDPVHELLRKWRHVAYAEMKDPGTYSRLMATAERALATGDAPPGSVSGDEIRALIRRRLDR